jgi:hypothetical protein
MSMTDDALTQFCNARDEVLAFDNALRRVHPELVSPLVFSEFQTAASSLNETTLRLIDTSTQILQFLRDLEAASNGRNDA